jgi:hypothetical protein
MNLRRLMTLMIGRVDAPRVFSCLLTGDVSAATVVFAFTYFAFVFGGS